MANHASSKKRVKRNEKRAEINGARRGRMRTFIKKLEECIAESDSKAAQEALTKVQQELGRAVSKGIVHKNAAARKLSRLSAKVKAI